MKFTDRYWRSLDSLDGFVMRHRPALEAYKSALGLARKAIRDRAQMLRNEYEDSAGIKRHLTEHADNPEPEAMVVSSGLLLDVQSEEQALQREEDAAFKAIRDSEQFKRVIDMRDELIIEKNDARNECYTAEDHPLIAVRKMPEEAWMISLDEMNYDRAHATTLEDKSRIEKNIRDLADSELNEKMMEEHARDTIKRQQLR
jgi:hypothetical protein